MRRLFPLAFFVFFLVFLYLLSVRSQMQSGSRSRTRWTGEVLNNRRSNSILELGRGVVALPGMRVTLRTQKPIGGGMFSYRKNVDETYVVGRDTPTWMTAGLVGLPVGTVLGHGPNGFIATLVEACEKEMIGWNCSPSRPKLPASNGLAVCATSLDMCRQSLGATIPTDLTDQSVELCLLGGPAACANLARALISDLPPSPSDPRGEPYRQALKTALLLVDEADRADLNVKALGVPAVRTTQMIEDKILGSPEDLRELLVAIQLGSPSTSEVFPLILIQTKDPYRRRAFLEKVRASGIRLPADLEAQLIAAWSTLEHTK